MTSVRLLVFAVVALLQIGVPARMIISRSRTLAHGAVWKFRTAPVDPVDAMRGRYISLRFAAEDFVQKTSEPFPHNVWAILKNDADGFAIIDHLSATKVAGDNIMKIETAGWYEEKQRVRFPFDRLWVTERNGPAADRAYAEHSRLHAADAFATVRVRDGDAAIEELYIGGQPLTDFLRDHPPQ